MAQKLYTEEQVREMLKSTHIHTDNDVNMILPQFKPIELPSDEEIHYNAPFQDGREYSFGEHHGFMKGAKWMREQIINQNK